MPTSRCAPARRGRFRVSVATTRRQTGTRRLRRVRFDDLSGEARRPGTPLDGQARSEHHDPYPGEET